MVVSEHLQRHDRNYEQALAAAETGLASLVTQAKASPYATSIAPVSGTDANTNTSWSGTATGGNGHWVLTSTGVANGSKTPVTRRISQTLDVRSLLSNPLFGTTSVTVGGGASDSGIDTYDSSASSAVCLSDGVTPAPTGMLGWKTKMCTPATPATGRVGTNGPLTLPGAALANMAGADIYDSGVPGHRDATDLGRCVGDSTTCNAVGSAVLEHQDPLEFPLSTQCSSGIGAGALAYDGTLSLAANAVYSFTDVTLNATAIANLGNVAGSTLVICFSGTLNVVPTVPLNSTVSGLQVVPRAPSTLILISTAGTPRVRLNAGLLTSSKLSAVIYAPNADCTATAHVDLYGAMVCSTINAPDGMHVHYDTRVGQIPFDQPVTVSKWREQ
jgi:hypothetical protein